MVGEKHSSTALTQRKRGRFVTSALGLHPCEGRAQILALILACLNHDTRSPTHTRRRWQAQWLKGLPKCLQVRRSFGDYQGSSTDSFSTHARPITVIVGSGADSVTFYIPEDSLVAHSDFFAVALGREWEEAEEKVVRLVEDKGRLFKVFADFVYKGSVSFRPVQEGCGESQQHETEDHAMQEDSQSDSESASSDDDDEEGGSKGTQEDSDSDSSSDDEMQDDSGDSGEDEDDHKDVHGDEDEYHILRDC